MFKTFLKPKWVLLAVFVVAFSYFAFTLLAPWQLGKDHRIVERNKQIEAAYEADPVPLADAVNADGSLKAEWTRVQLQGHFLPDSEILLRLRPVASGPTYQSLVPFQDNSGLTMLVNRGWVAAGEGNAVPTIDRAPSGEVSLTAMVRTDESTQGASEPIVDQGYQQVYVINTEQISELTHVSLGHDYLQISHPDQPGVLNYIPVPTLDRGSHLSYGFQWIAFGIMAPLGLGYFIYAELRERRRNQEEQAALDAANAAKVTLADAATAGAATAPAAATAAPGAQSASESAKPQPVSSRRSRTRYGDAKPDFYEKFSRRGVERFD